MNFLRTTQSYDRIGARNYGLLFNERLRRMQEDQAFLRELRERGPGPVREEAIVEEQLNNDPELDGEEQDLEHDFEHEFVQDEQSNDQDEDGETETDYANMPLNDRILFYATFVQHFGISQQQIYWMEILMRVVYGTAPPVTYNHHVASFNSNLLTEYDRKRQYFCCSCEGRLNEWRDVCENSACKLYRVSIKRAKGVQRIEVHVLNMIPQLSDVISKEITSIIEMHSYLHENRERATHDRSDIRFYDGFYDNIETTEEFNRKRIKLLLTLSVDGFVPKRITRREMWPLYLRVDNLPRAEADKYLNSILCGMIYSLSKPSSKMMETMFARLESELNALREEPIEIDLDGQCWSVDVSLYRGVADMQAQKTLFGIPRWSSEQGCSKCYIMGQRLGGQRVWITTENDDTNLRRPESFSDDGEMARNGVPAVTPIMRMIAPCDFSGDALHVCSEGITRDRLRDLFSASSKFRELLISRQGTEAVKKTLKEMSSYTYASSFILSLDDLRTCKAVELDEIAFVTFPLVAAAALSPSPLAAVSLLGYWLCLRIIADSRHLSTTNIRNAQKIASITKHIWASMAAEIFTMKCHWFFDHGMQEEIESYGSAYQWSAAPFESHHRRLQIKVDQTLTNSSTTIIERYLVYKKTRNLLEERCATNHALFSLNKKVDNKHRTRFPVGVRISETVYIPKGSRVEQNLLQDDHKARVLRSGEDAYSRIVINGKMYSSRIYWKRPSHSRQDMVYMKGRDGNDELNCFGSIVLFLYDRSRVSVRALVDEYHFINPFEHLGNLMHHTPHPLRRAAIELMNLIEEHNIYFQELTEKHVRVRPISCIQSACTTLKFANHSYASKL